MMFKYANGFFEEQTRLIKSKGVDVSVIYNENRSIASISLKKFRYVHFQKQYKVEKDVPVLRRMNWNIIPAKYNIGKRIWVNDSIKLFELYVRNYGKPDLIHVHCAFNAGVVAKYIKEKWAIPYIVTEHSSEYSAAFSISKAKEAFEIYDNADKVIAVSNYLKNLICEKVNFDKQRIEVIPNFIDTDFFDPNASTNHYERENVIFTACNLIDTKRLDRLLEAFKIVSTQQPHWKLIIAGSGPEKDKLELLVKDLGLFDKVIFTGFLTKEQIRDQLMKARIFVSSSDIETFSVVLIEAMSMGLPVVATASGGPKDIVTKETGILAEKTSAGLAYSLTEVILNYMQYKKESIRNYAINNFSGESIANKYINIYRQITLK